MKVTFVSAAAGRQTIKALPGQTVMEAAVQNDVAGIDGECGGSCNCGTCHVWVDEAWLTKLVAAEPMETNLLDGMENVRSNSRLCCQIKVSDTLAGLVLYLPSK